MSVKVNIIRNPFEPGLVDRQIYSFDSEYVVEDYLPQIDPSDNLKLAVAKNGIVLNPPYTQSIQDGDVLSVSFKVQGTVSAAVATFVVGSTWAATAGVTAAAWAITAGITYAAISFAVGYGINQLVSALGLGPEKPDMGGGEAQSPTYGWGPLRQVETQGNPISVLFGSHKVAGQVINQFTTVEEDDKEYLYVLLAVADHVVDSITDIRINDQPVSSYSNVTTYTRLGTLNDDPIFGFAQLTTQHNIQVGLVNHSDLFTYQTDGNAVTDLLIILSAPRGLYYSNDDGGLDERSVTFEIDYRTVGSSTWINYGEVKIFGSTTEQIRKQVSITGLSPDQWEVRVTRTSSSTSSSREEKYTQWSQFNETIDEQLIYPGVAKYAIKALATDQLSGQRPRFSCLATRDQVQVYNPDTDAWEYRDANNPAWQAYWMLNTHHEIHHSRILYDEFEAWALYCDETVEGEARFRSQVYLDNQTNAWENIQKLARIARGTVLRRGTKYGVFVDKPESTISHLFTIGNIIEESFVMQYLPQEERANAAEITYNDPDRDYTNQVVAVYSDNYTSADTKSKKSSIKYNAAIRRSQAIREAAFLLNSNKYLIRTIEFEATVDSFACVVGDLVYFQHFIPHYNEAWGGRVIDAGNDDGNGNPYIQIDQEIKLQSGTSYGIIVRLSDDSLVEKSLQTVDITHTTDTFLLQSDWSQVPQQYDLYDFGIATTYKKMYRITNITRAQNLTRKITCMEYRDEIYNDTSQVIENPGWSEEVKQEATNMQVREFLTYGKGGDYQSNLSVSWQPATLNVQSNWAIWIEDKTLDGEFEDGTFEEDSIAETFSLTGPIKVGESAKNNMVIGPSYLTQGHKYKIYVLPAGEGGPA